MRYLILFLSFNLFAKGWISEADLTNCHNKTPYTVYTKDKGDMYDITGKDCETHTIQDVEVDDHSKPIYAAKTDFEDCILAEIDPETPLPANDCRVLIAQVNTGTEEAPVYEYTLCSDKTYYALYGYKKDFPVTFPSVTDDSLFSFCTKILGYNKKITKQLLPDANLLAIKAAKDDLKAQEEQAKADAKQAIVDAKGKIKDLTKEELNDLIEKIILLLGE